MFDREREAELAKADYLVFSIALINGIEPQNFERKLKGLEALKQNLVDVIYQVAFDPRYKHRQERQKLRKVDTDKLMERVAGLGKG